MWNCSEINATEPCWYYVDIGLSYSLVPSDNKPLPELMLTQIYVAISLGLIAGENEMATILNVFNESVSILFKFHCCLFARVHWQEIDIG